MPIFDVTQSALEQAMHGASMRQELLSANLANANTAGYVRQDLDFHGALSSAMAAGAPAKARFSPSSDAAAVRADGSSVDVDREAAELAKNGLEYQAIVAAARGRIDILAAAMGAGG